MPKQRYEQWTPEALTPGQHDPGEDELSAAVGRQEDLDALRDPEATATPTITRVFNGRQASPVPAQIDHYAGPDPSAPPVVDRVEIRSHLEPRPESTDRHSDDQLDRQAAEREANR